MLAEGHSADEWSTGRGDTGHPQPWLLQPPLRPEAEDPVWTCRFLERAELGSLTRSID